MALSELQKRQLENQAFAKRGGRKFLKAGVESAEEETNRKLQQALAMSEEQRKKRSEEASNARESVPDVKSLMEAEAAGDILPDVMPGDKTADMNMLPKAAQSQRVDPYAKLRTKQGYMSMINAMESGNIPEQTDDMGRAAAQANFDDTVDKVFTEDAMKKYPGVGDLDGKTSSEIAQDLMSRYNTKMSRTTPGGMNLPEKSSDAMAKEIMSRVNTRRSGTTGGLENLDTRTSDEIKKGLLSELNTRGSRTTPGMENLDETPSDSIAQNIMSRVNTDRSQTVPGMENMDSRSSEEMVRGLEENVAQRRVDAANIARQEKFDSQNKAERERLFAGLEKKEKALAKEASGKYYVDPITGYAINLDKLKKHAKRQEVMAIAKELPAATKVKYLRNEGILDDEDIPKDQKLTLEKEKLRVEIAKIKAQTNEIKNKNPQAEVLVDMAGEAFEIGAYDAGFQLLQDAYGEPLPQNISKIFQSIKSKSSKKGGADDIDYAGHWFDPVKTGMPGKDYANRFYNTVRDVRQELTAIRENPLDETSVGKAVNLFAAHGINYQEFIERVKPGSLEYQDAFKKVVEKEVDARLGRPGIYNGVFIGLADDMAQENAVLQREQAIMDGKPVPVESPIKEGAFRVSDDVEDVSAEGSMGTATPEATEFEQNFPLTNRAAESLFDAAGEGSSLSTEDEIREDGSVNTSLGSAARIMSGEAGMKAIAKKLVEMKVDPESNQDKYNRIIGSLIPDGFKNWLQNPRNKEVYDNALKQAIDNEKKGPQPKKLSGLQAATRDTFKNPSSGSEKTREHEDFSAKPYKDGGGWSIGHGFHLDKESITKADLQGSGIPDVVKKALLAGDHTNKNLKLTNPQSEKIFQNIYNRRRRETARTYPWVRDLPEQAKNVVYDMAFNLGRTKFKKFEGMLEALEQGDYKKAALHVKFVDGPKRGKLTPYWGQTKSRAEDNFDILMRL